MSSLYTPPSSKKPVYKRKGFWIGVGVLVVIGGVANAGKDSSTVTDAKPQATVTVTAPAAPVESKAPTPVESKAPAAAESTPKVVEATAEEAEPEVPDVPDVVGMNHADAQSLLRSQGFMVNEEDASPEGRMILLNSNWKVCSQDPAPGTSGESVLRVAIYSVKLEETC
ncbi:putative membrane protein [Streptomyces sp. SAI-170]|uniref:PASTA domain-containing protein n=1 Tax=Streptomyces sp. SAI-170 TaxID=3377729 RepID=UPI003C7C58AD